MEARTRYLLNLATAPLVDLDDGAGVTVVVTGVFSNTLNGVCGARLSADEADAVIGEIVARLDHRRAPAIWHVDGESRPHDLGRRLEAAGCTPETSGVVRGGLVTDVLERISADGVEVTPVRTAEDLDHWFDVAAHMWGEDLDDPPGNRERWRRLLTELGLSANAPLQHYVAFAEGRAVGMSSAFFCPDDSLVLIDHEDVAGHARRSGVGTAMLRAMLAEAQRRGCRYVVLEPTPESVPFYNRLGLAEEPVQAGHEFYLPLT